MTDTPADWLKAKKRLAEQEEQAKREMKQALSPEGRNKAMEDFEARYRIGLHWAEFVTTPD